MKHIVIIGNGISGITAARHIRKLSDYRITVISSETEHFYSRTALMYIYMGHMKYEHTKPYEDWFWKKNRIELKQGYVVSVDTENKQLQFKNNDLLGYDKLILATGSQTATYGWEGLSLNGVQGLVNIQDVQALENNTENCKHAVIIGGGLIGVELAEMLSTRKIPVTFLIRESYFWNSVLPENDAKHISKHILSHGISLKPETNLDKILGDNNGNVRAVLTDSGEEISCDVVGICTGVKPNINFLEGSGIATDKGILVNRKLETNVKDIYAIGDCAQQHEAIGYRKPVEAVWYTGRMMGETVAQTICGKTMPYNPGNWFNSAKFFDVEYQTYGWVFNDKNKKEGETHFHWKNPEGDQWLTIAYHEETLKFLGINTFGIRMKHETFDSWLNENQNVAHVVDNLRKANFDPEFYKILESNIQISFKNHLSSKTTNTTQL
ncbi:NAD(P)/FAD-dependent oxidoreductase [Croceibacter atlanticus]|uniref:NAD(P)/FAD-dependent oxidoreductase n=1 Tax=Croceibacter atlanticus TaxID=313588 RepID=UPI0030DBF2F4|tara:strand:+ start:34065 stop:35378 length:1314 start_codon:yes stop_codon:yes gene_type:complete